jgi:hypothetical protein
MVLTAGVVVVADLGWGEDGGVAEGAGGVVVVPG